MANKGVASLGLVLAAGDGNSPEVFTNVAEVTDINGLAISRKTVDITHLLNTWEEIKPTTLQMKPLKLTVNFLPDDATQRFVTGGIGFDMVNGTLRNFKITYPTATPKSWVFSAYVTSFDPKGSVQGKLSADIELSPSGAPTLA